MGIILSEKLQEKIEFYEKIYFALDEPVPFRKDILVYPVTVKDYYKFYSTLSCLTMDKNTKMVKETDEKTGRVIDKQVSNPLGLSMSYMGYLCEMMTDKDYGAMITNQVTTLMEMVLHIKNGFFCPHCKSKNAEHNLEEIVKGLQACETDEQKNEYWKSIIVCPDCGESVREIYTIKDNGKIKKFCIKDYECSPKDFEELIAIITHQNILGYDDDIYIDPELKKDLDLKKKLQNQDFQSPTLEKQITAVGISTGYDLEYLKNLPMRKLSFMLKLIDSKEMYYTIKGAEMSGLVSFKKDPTHWIYSNDGFGRDISKEIYSVDELKKKFENVV